MVARHVAHVGQSLCYPCRHRRIRRASSAAAQDYCGGPDTALIQIGHCAQAAISPLVTAYGAASYGTVPAPALLQFYVLGVNIVQMFAAVVRRNHSQK